MSKLYKAYISSYRMDTPDWENYLKYAGDIYNAPQLQQLSGFEQHFKINRLQHIRSVAYLSFLVSRKLGLDYKSTARAATMHDLFYYDWREDDLSHKLHGYRHPGTALKNAYYLCGTLNKKEEDINSLIDELKRNEKNRILKQMKINEENGKHIFLTC